MLSAAALEHVQNLRHRGPLDHAQYGVAGVPGDGPYVELWVRLDGAKVTAASFNSHGCPSSLACGSLICSLLEKMPSIEPLKRLTASEILAMLGGLPEGKEFCADLALRAAQSAVYQTS